jgi:hypothetical protein
MKLLLSTSPKPATRDVDKANIGLELLGAALMREPLQQAWGKVKAYNGTLGVDGLDIEKNAQMFWT